MRIPAAHSERDFLIAAVENVFAKLYIFWIVDDFVLMIFIWANTAAVRFVKAQDSCDNALFASLDGSDFGIANVKVCLFHRHGIRQANNHVRNARWQRNLSRRYFVQVIEEIAVR